MTRGERYCSSSGMDNFVRQAETGGPWHSESAGETMRTKHLAVAALVLLLAYPGLAYGAPACRNAGHPCEGNQRCCDDLVCAVTGPGAAKRCTPCPTGQIACAGACIPACRASDQCHVAGVCDPTTGQCTNPSVGDGTTCEDGDACTRTDTCRGGSCDGGDPVVCSASDQCHEAGVCDPYTGQCSDPAKPDGSTCDADGDYSGPRTMTRRSSATAVSSTATKPSSSSTTRRRRAMRSRCST
jgi:hypothetical protein